MKRLVLIALLSGCNATALDDGYQIGDGLNMAADGLQRLQAAVDRYCSTAPGDPARNTALAIIRIRYPDIPENGICTGLPNEDF